MQQSRGSEIKGDLTKSPNDLSLPGNVTSQVAANCTDILDSNEDIAANLDEIFENLRSPELKAVLLKYPERAKTFIREQKYVRTITGRNDEIRYMVRNADGRIEELSLKWYLDGLHKRIQVARIILDSENNNSGSTIDNLDEETIMHFIETAIGKDTIDQDLVDVISVFNLTEAQIIDLITKCYQLITDRNKKTVMQLRIELDAMQAKVTKLMNTEAGLAKILENTQKRQDNE